ncbi:unnamed protein product [marine sediment metagenome]|uniref:Gfo/Idh/MocA-like oxidoreductase N-terminal domain-containing protein n=1 Tax=marine sediment metagenome TaxID=412755 RepID=X1AXC8_9ZZZZ
MVKVGILGAGFMGGMHAEVYRNLPNAELVGVADRDLDKARKLAGRHRATAYSTTEDWHIISITTIILIHIILHSYTLLCLI